MRSNLLLIVATLVIGTVSASADLHHEFTGFDTVWEVGVSGQESSYHADTRSGTPLSGATTANSLASFGPNRVSYPSGIGPVPSPGGAVGRNFDQGVLGTKIEGGKLVVRLAGGLNPQAGYYHNGWHTWYGQGNVFVTVGDSAGISHFALLSAWARDAAGNPISLNGGHFDAARAFHVGGGAGGSSLEGHLIRLTADADITPTGGTGSYDAGNAPAGLDLRAFAEGGQDVADASLTHSSLWDLGQTWYLQTWTIGLSGLSSDPAFSIGLHSVASCGNDQIGDCRAVPEPSSVLLALGGCVLLFCFRRLG